VGTRHTGALALMAQQHKVVHVIYCQSQRLKITKLGEIVNTSTINEQ